MNKYFVSFLFYFFSAYAEANNVSDDLNCISIKNYLTKHTAADGVIILNEITDGKNTIRLGSQKSKKQYDLNSSQLSDLKRIWLYYADLDNDNKKELFASWVSYANTYTDNRSSVFIFDYPNHSHLEEIFSKGKYKSEFYPELEYWMIKNFVWDSYAGPVGAQNVLPETLRLSDEDIWNAGKGFSNPPNDYFLTVFDLDGVHYILVSGRHEKTGKAYVVKLTNAEQQSYESVCPIDVKSL